MKVLFVISDLGMGGAQRVISILSNHWAKKSTNQVSIITFRNVPPAYKLNKVNRIELTIPKNKTLRFAENYTRFKKLSNAFKKYTPDIIISFITENNILSILASKYNGIPVIISERSNPFIEKLSLPWKILRKFCYRYADLLVLQTEGVERFYKNYNVRKLNIKNPINYTKKIKAANKEKIIISTGRLTSSKNFDLIINCFANISNKDGWKLYILGEGNERPRLEKLISDLSLTSSVKLMGSVENVFEYLIKSEIFIMLSDYEGYPNSLIEAMSAGLPVISSNCDFGPEEIVLNNHNGLLVNIKNKNEIEDALINLMDNHSKRIEIGKKAKEITNYLNTETIALQWEDVIGELIQ